MSPPDRTTGTRDPAGSDGQHGRAFLNLGRFMILLGLVNPPFWGSIIRGINKGTFVACAMFSGLMIAFGAMLMLVGRHRIAREPKGVPGQENDSHDWQQ